MLEARAVVAASELTGLCCPKQTIMRVVISYFRKNSQELSRLYFFQEKPYLPEKRDFNNLQTLFQP